MIYKVVHNEDIRKSNDNIDATAAFAVCTSRELKYVFLTYDFGTPLKQLSFEDRRVKAAEYAGYHIEPVRKRLDKTGRKLLNGGFINVERAIIEFKKQRRDLDRETLEAYDIQLEEFNQRQRDPKKTDKDWDIALKIVEKMPKLLKVRREMIDVLDLSVDFKEELIESEIVDEVATEETALERRNRLLLDE